MRRPTTRQTLPALLIAALCALALAACGSSAGTRHAGASAKQAATDVPAATTTALSYMPADAPFVAVVGTSADSGTGRQLASLQRQVPAVALLKAALFQQMAKLGIDYNADVKPLLGNPITIAALPKVGDATARAHRSGRGEAFGGTSDDVDAVLAWQTADAAALKRLIGTVHELTPAGSSDGATLYHASGATVAVKGPELIVASTPGLATQALQHHDAGTGFGAADYARDLSGISPDALVTMVGNPAPLLAQPQAAAARKIPWVAALTGYGAALEVKTKAVALQYHVRTDGQPLTDAQLPIASGSQSPGLAGSLPLTGALRDPAQVWTFVKPVLQATEPARYAKLMRGEARSKAEGIDIEKLLAQFSGNLAVESDGNATLVRAAVADPGFVEQTLKQMAAHPVDPLEGGKPDRYTALGDGLYRIANHGSPTDVQIAGVVGDTFVLGEHATAQQLRAYATVPAQPLAGASGAGVFRIAIGPLVKTIGGGLGGSGGDPVATQVLSHLGDLTGSLQASTTAIDGVVSLALK